MCEKDEFWQFAAASQRQIGSGERTKGGPFMNNGETRFTTDIQIYGKGGDRGGGGICRFKTPPTAAVVLAGSVGLYTVVSASKWHINNVKINFYIFSLK